MKLQSSKNGSNFVCGKGTLSQIRSQMQCSLQPFPKLVMEPNHMCLLLTPLLSPLIIWSAEMFILLIKNPLLILAVFQDPDHLVHTIGITSTQQVPFGIPQYTKHT